MKNILILVFILCLTGAYAQESSQVPDENKTEPAPLELPNFIIEGVEQLNVKSGIKQIPERTYPLSKAELDSLNSLEKKEQYPLPLEQLPSTVITGSYLPGYIKAHFGRFSDALLEGGFGMNREGFELFGSAGVNYSAGHIDDAEFTDINAKITSDYIADKKFFIFGGSRTRTALTFRNLAYNLYSMPDLNNDDKISNDRNATNLGFSLDVDGNWEGLQFRTGASAKTLQLSSKSEYYNERKAHDNNLSGYIQAKNLWKNFLIMGNVDVDFRNTGGQSTNFAQADVSAELFNDLFTVKVNTGFQYAINSSNIDRGGLLLSGTIEYRLNQKMTFIAGLESGLKKQNLTDFFQQNPYMMINSKIDFPYDIMKIKGKYFYQPLERFGFSVSGNMSVTDRFPYFNDSLNSEFSVEYAKVNIARIEVETYWDISDKNSITAYLLTNFAGFDIGDNSIPNLPVNQLGINYSHKLYEKFGTKFGLHYTGDRFSDKENNIEIDGYFNLNAKFNYDILNNLRIFLNIDNLTNSEIYIWNGYKERGIYAALGFMWQF